MQQPSPNAKYGSPYRIRKTRQQKSQSKLPGSSSHPVIRVKYSLQKKNQKPDQINLFKVKNILHNPQKVNTEPTISQSMKRLPRRITEIIEAQQTESQQPYRQRKKTEHSPQRNHLKFHQISQDLPLIKTKRYNNFNQHKHDNSSRLIQQTNIHLSADAWVAYDRNENKYIRGWKAQMMGPAHNLTRLLLIYTVFQKLEEYGINCRDLKTQLKVFRANKEDNLKPILHDNTIITVYELIFGLMLTSNQQLYDHLLTNIGYLITLHNQSHRLQDLTHQHSSPTPYSQVLSTNLLTLPNFTHIAHYRSTMANQMQHCLHHLKMSRTILSRTENYQMQTCALDLCILFRACYQNALFQEMYLAKTRTSPIRYQLGYNYSEDRKVKWVGTAHWEEGFDGMLMGWREGKVTLNNSIITFHKETNILIVLFQSKFHVGSLDLRRVMEWCSINYISKKLPPALPQGLSMKTLPLNNR